MPISQSRCPPARRPERAGTGGFGYPSFAVRGTKLQAMVLGTFFKTGFEKGSASHEQLVKVLLPLLKSTKTSYWPYHYGSGDSGVLARQAGTALNRRLQLPGKNRRFCIPSGATPATDILLWKGTGKASDDVNLQVRSVAVVWKAHLPS